jgi:hypothetical protein
MFTGIRIKITSGYNKIKCLRGAEKSRKYPPIPSKRVKDVMTTAGLFPRAS